MINKKHFNYLIISIICILVGILTEHNILFPRFDHTYVKRFQKVFLKKDNELQKIIDQLSEYLNVTGFTGASDPMYLEYNDLLKRKGLAVFVYQNDKLKYWSDNDVVISSEFSSSGIDSSFIYLENAWFIPKVVKIKNNITLVGLILIKQVYPYENKLLTTEFYKDFGFPSSVKISSRVVPNSYPIVSSRGIYLFSLVFDSNTFHPVYELYIPAICYVLFFIFLLIFLFKVINAIKKNGRRHRAIAITALLLFGIKIFFQNQQIPAAFYKLSLFNPIYFATSELLSSFGELLIWVSLIFYIILLLYTGVSIEEYLKKYFQKRIQKHIILIFHFSLLLLFFSWIFYLLKSLIINSTISFEVNKLMTFDAFSLIGYFVIILVFTSFVFLFDKILIEFADYISFKKFYLLLTLTCLVFLLTEVLLSGTVYWKSMVFILILGGVFGYIRLELKKSYSYPSLILITFIFAVYTVLFVSEYSKIKNGNNKKVLLAANLANEHDRIGEFILIDNIQRRLKSDSTINQILFSDYFNIDLLYNHLKSKYFSSYFDKYLLRVTPCSPIDSLYIEPPEDAWYPCYDYFSRMILEKGSRITNTDFYYIDNLDGLLSYLGWFNYHNANGKSSVSIFVELISKLTTEELGYPALLLDERYSYKSSLKGFSYAKYYNGQLISQYGKHMYNLSSKVYEEAHVDFSELNIGGFDHMVFRPNKETLIVLSSPSLTFIDLLISFSYTFLIYFLIITISIGIFNISLIRQSIFPNFKNKIQFSMLSILFLSLILIGGGTLYYNLNQYYKKHIDILTEKLQAIYNELSKSLGHEDQISSDWSSYPYSSINELLIKFSNVFYVDINLYSPQGMLLGSSRPEIFEKGLIGSQINSNAYKELVYNTQAEVINTEQIGKQKFISIYVPLKNDANKLLAFLNIPYFARQEEFTSDISGMIITVINIYVILLLITFIIAVVISRSITLPLREIQTKFSKIKLGQKYEKIVYPRKDEIGGLVDEYNRMVTELERSVALLAKSERESAWREMAKQIAHEINNPLTPMKLSIQHLQRAWTDKRENFDEYIQRIGKTLIDEIDNLSSIAVEFSNFAKMPNAINQKINLIEKIENVVNLFSSNNVKFSVVLNGLKNAYVYADKEQISRVFINLIKNAIQSVDKGTTPSILININLEDRFYKVELLDNGKGIPIELREKLFRPNFTTKTSGMGLGLSIVKNIIEGIGGTISYETKENKGTKFILRIPVYNS